MGARLDQGHRAELREGCRPTARPRPAEGTVIGRGIGHLERGAIQRHQAQSAQEGAFRLGCGDRPGDGVEQQSEQPRPGALARPYDGSIGRELPGAATAGRSFTPARHDIGERMADRLTGPQPHRHHQRHHQLSRQAAPPLFAGARGLDDRRHRLIRNGRLECLQQRPIPQPSWPPLRIPGPSA